MAKINGIELYYETHGKGEPLVLISGFMMNCLAWAPILPLLAEHYQVIAFDNRGVGQTDAPDEPYSLEQMAEDTLALLHHLKIDRAHVLGFSMGSVIAQILAASSPQSVDKLVLAGTADKRNPRIAYQLNLMGELFEAGLHFHQIMALQLPYLFSESFFSDQLRVDEMKRTLRSEPYPPTPNSYWRQYASLKQFESSALLPKIAAPTLVLGFEEDLATPPAEGEQVAKQISNAQFELLPKTGHCGFTEAPDSFCKIILEFLNTRAI